MFLTAGADGYFNIFVVFPQPDDAPPPPAAAAAAAFAGAAFAQPYR
jgi:hypothetical protein